MPKMLILRGTHGSLPDESGKTHNYKDGALHEGAAKEFARRKGYEGVVLNVSGDAPSDGKRIHSIQTLAALKAFREDKDVAAFYGFSGGGYNVYWILQSITERKEFERIKLVVVLGAPERAKADLEKSKYTGGGWELIYKTNPPGNSKVVPKGLDSHMFGPEWLLAETPDPAAKTP